jgi:hypothetical protein
LNDSRKKIKITLKAALLISGSGRLWRRRVNPILMGGWFM